MKKIKLGKIKIKKDETSVMKSYVIDKLALSKDKVCVKTFTEFCERD